MRLFSILIIVLFIAACSNPDDNYLKPRNLLEYGIPYTILTPDSVDIQKENLVVQDEVIIKSQKSDDYEVRVYFGEATKDVTATKAEHLNNLKSILIFIIRMLFFMKIDKQTNKKLDFAKNLLHL